MSINTASDNQIMSHSDTALIMALQNPTIYPHAATDIELVETHISWVILVGSFAYKIKKPLNLGFLDFSTLKKRLLCCQEELRLNRCLAPDIYLAVIPIRGSVTAPQLTGKGTVLEYAVKMQRFDRTQSFDQLLSTGQLSTHHLTSTALTVAGFHARIRTAEVHSSYGSPEMLLQPVRENFSQIEKIPGLEQQARLKRLHTWSEQTFCRLYDHFGQRKQTGYIRECHGDLHLTNLVWLHDNAVPFDGIEFNPNLYWIDVLNEVAFLVMDLSANRQNELAFHFLNTYLEKTGDYQGLAILPFYLTYRAIVMAKVCAIRSGQMSNMADTDTCMQSFADYLQLAESYTRPAQPTLFIMHGVSCSGKSRLSEQLATRCHAIRIRSDVERKRLFPDISGNELYSAEISDQTYRQLANLAQSIMTAGYSVVVDAAFLQRQQRSAFRDLAEAMHSPFLIIETCCTEAVLRQRMQQRAMNLNEVSDADNTVLTLQLQSRQPINADELSFILSVDTSSTVSQLQFWQQLAQRTTRPCDSSSY